MSDGPLASETPFRTAALLSSSWVEEDSQADVALTQQVHHEWCKVLCADGLEAVRGVTRVVWDPVRERAEGQRMVEADAVRVVSRDPRDARKRLAKALRRSLQRSSMLQRRD